MENKSDGLTTLELFKMFRESDEASFTVWLEKNIEWVEEERFEDGGVTSLREDFDTRNPISITFPNGSKIIFKEEE